MLFRHNVTFFGGELLVRGAEHEHRSLRSSFCSEWSRIWFVRVGWRCWRVTYTHFITLNAKTTETTPVIWCPWERKAQVSIGCKWAPHGPSVFGLLTLIWSELRLTWTPPWMLQRHIKRPSPDTLGTDTFWTMPLVLECPSAFRWCCWSNPFRHAMQPLSL